jgi:hypothetical protein
MHQNIQTVEVKILAATTFSVYGGSIFVSFKTI